MSSRSLQAALDALYGRRSPHQLANDPVSFCHRFREPADREVAGLIAAAFAYGNVKIILRNLETVFERIGPSPRRFAERFVPEAGARLFAGFKHRFNDSRDLCALLYALRLMLAEAGSIENFFLAGLDPEAPDVTAALHRFSSTILAFDYSPVFGTAAPPPDSFYPFLFPSPRSGSACKRLCMYLRWMVRPADGIDLGVWQAVTPAMLIIPVDAHICRISRLLGLTARNQADWKMAREITAALRQLDPLDPVKYDFSLCHLGISDGCTGRRSGRCSSCAVEGICCAKLPGGESR